MTVEKDFDPYRSRKTLYHAFRCLDFGTQIATSGKIEDYTRTIELWRQITTDNSEDWDHYKTLYHRRLKNNHSKFKKLAPKINI